MSRRSLPRFFHADGQLTVVSRSEHLELADYRRRVFSLYDALRHDGSNEALRLERFRSARDQLFREHPQSAIPLSQRERFAGLVYFPHDPALRFAVELEPDPAPAPLELPRSGSGSMQFQRIGWVRFAVREQACRLAVYWVVGYAGGIFIPFRDATSGREAYGGGRYVWDSIKGADLGSDGRRLVLDFNYAYHPSCVYDGRWSCPLAPSENWLSAAISAGERLPDAGTASGRRVKHRMNHRLYRPPKGDAGERGDS
ncbi:MAG: DUF1684 domain-containing protein [Candidatus Limnocylindria bacterium]